jgi:hypothetical protein
MHGLINVKICNNICVLFISRRIDFHQLAAPNLANSAVLKMLEEEERQRGGKGKIFVEFHRSDDQLTRWVRRVDVRVLKQSFS